MPNFTGMRLTRIGMELLGLTGAGAVLDFTRVAVGSGLWSEAQQSAPAELTGLVREEMSLDIGSIAPTSVPETDEAAGSYTIFTMLTNSGLESGFTLRELGIFATHPSRGEILYAVVYSGDDQYDYIPQLPAGAAPLEKQFRIDVVTGNAKEITIKQSPVLLATHDDISEHDVNPEAHPDLLARLATGTPEILNPADGATNIGETPIITAREFVPVFANTEHQASQWQVDLLSGNFSNPVFDSGPSSVALNSFELPAGYLQVSTVYKMRTRRRLNTGQWSPWAEPKTFTTKDIFNYVERPANAEPISGATNVGECPTLKSSPFAVVGDEPDTHAATQFRIRQGDTILHLSDEFGAVLEYLIPAGLLQVSTDYVFECRHKGTLLGWSEWSTATGFRTASAFITGDEAVYPSSWVGHDNASSAGVALADDAALRSNGIDQDEGETDWVDYSVRAKVRSEGLNIIAATTDKIETSTSISDVVNIVTNLGRLNDVPVSGIAMTPFVGIMPEHNYTRIVFCVSDEYIFIADVNLYRYTKATGEYITIDNNLWPTGGWPFGYGGLACSRDGQILLMGFADHQQNGKYGAALSTDGGHSWTKITTGTGVYTYPPLLTVSPDGQKLAYSTYMESAVHISKDGGNTWTVVATSENALSVYGAQVTGLFSTDDVLLYNGRSNFNIGISHWDNNWVNKYNLADSTEGLGNTIRRLVGNICVCQLGAFLADKDDSLTVGDFMYFDITDTDPFPKLTKINNVTGDAKVMGTAAYHWSSNQDVFYTAYLDTDKKLIISPIDVLSGDYYVRRSLDISAAGYTEAPNRAHIMPKLTAATGADSAAFTSADFTEIDIENATLGTDSDPDRPDFILLESAKQTPAEPFRRVALGLSGLSKDSECRVSETQADVWKTGV